MEFQHAGNAAGQAARRGVECDPVESDEGHENSGVCSNVTYSGDWTALAIAVFGPGFDIIVDPYTQKANGMVEIAVNAYLDTLCLQPASFATCDDVLTPYSSLSRRSNAAMLAGLPQALGCAVVLSAVCDLLSCDLLAVCRHRLLSCDAQRAEDGRG